MPAVFDSFAYLLGKAAPCTNVFKIMDEGGNDCQPGALAFHRWNADQEGKAGTKQAIALTVLGITTLPAPGSCS